MTVGGRGASVSEALSYDAPTISGAVMSNMPTTGKNALGFGRGRGREAREREAREREREEKKLRAHIPSRPPMHQAMLWVVVKSSVSEALS